MLKRSHCFPRGSFGVLYVAVGLRGVYTTNTYSFSNFDVKPSLYLIELSLRSSNIYCYVLEIDARRKSVLKGIQKDPNCRPTVFQDGGGSHRKRPFLCTERMFVQPSAVEHPVYLYFFTHFLILSGLSHHLCHNVKTFKKEQKQKAKEKIWT